ncbi:MAG: histidinol-phosphate transaminase [Syntrophothermus sp.]
MNVENLVRKNIQKLKPYTCARDMYSEGILLDANENSMGSAIDEFESLGLNRYPDPHQNDLKKAAAEYLRTDPDKLFFGVGSDEIIDLLIRIFCEPGKDSVVILDPTYGMYKVACDINNVKTVSVPLNREFQTDFTKLDKAMKKDVKMIFACSPNNPTGGVLRKEDVIRMCSYNAIVVIDEAYIDFAPGQSVIEEVNNYNNLVVLRTFSKAWGLAAIRLGFSAAGETVNSYLFKVKAPYNISALTRYAALKALSDPRQKDIFVTRLIEERARLKDALEAMPGVEKVYPSDANYLLFKIANAREIQKSMAEEGVVIRDRSSQKGLEDCLRISVGTEVENDIFLNSLRKHLGLPYEELKQKASEDVKTPDDVRLPGKRTAVQERNTKETCIRISVDLDGQGKAEIKTGVGFFDHMLEQIARHANINLNIDVKGDLFVDEHHTVEDTGITLGMALSEALGDKRGIKRYGFFLPMDETIARCAIDLGGRNYLNFKCSFKRGRIGDFPTELTEEFFRGLASGLKANIYLKAKGKNDHHKTEALFKAFAKALNEACRLDERNPNLLPSTKGIL